VERSGMMRDPLKKALILKSSGFAELTFLSTSFVRLPRNGSHVFGDISSLRFLTNDNFLYIIECMMFISILLMSRTGLVYTFLVRQNDPFPLPFPKRER
jgi:hypothetical protein